MSSIFATRISSEIARNDTIMGGRFTKDIRIEGGVGQSCIHFSKHAEFDILNLTNNTRSCGFGKKYAPPFINYHEITPKFFNILRH